MIAYRVGCRGAATGLPFMQDLADRLVNRVHLSTDGHGVYPRAVAGVRVGWGRLRDAGEGLRPNFRGP